MTAFQKYLNNNYTKLIYILNMPTHVNTVKTSISLLKNTKTNKQNSKAYAV